MDGLGGLLIVPTRELAIQAFEVLRSFGGMHDLSAGLLIGGKNLKFEQDEIERKIRGLLAERQKKLEKSEKLKDNLKYNLVNSEIKDYK